MVDLHNKCASAKILEELSVQDRKFWFDFKQKKFLHNIDTFYYSVKFRNDFTDRSQDSSVKAFRHQMGKHQNFLRMHPEVEFLDFTLLGDTFLFRNFRFAFFYTMLFSLPEYFDILFAPVVPSAAGGDASVTCECIVQLRSYMLWTYGSVKAFKRSYEYVRAFAELFGFEIDFCQENRIDYCFHSNYLSNPEKFFSMESFHKMRVDRFCDAQFHTTKVGVEDYEVDYVAMGKRSDKIFIRIYLKSKEIVEMGYKPWFFYIWMLNGLISRYDLFCYELAFKEKKWKHLDKARLQFYLEYGTDEDARKRCSAVLSGEESLSEDALKRFADELTPKINLVMNVEYQTMRRHTKSYELFRVQDYARYGEAARIYQYFDNRKPIVDYLTHYVFRMVEPCGDGEKRKRDYCGFWKALRSTKLIDHKLKDRELKLIRSYTRKLNADIMKRRAINSITTFSLYRKGLNEDSILQDITDAVCELNDNDMFRALNYKVKRAKQLNSHQLDALAFGTSLSQRFKVNILDLDREKSYSNHNVEEEKAQ